jgi:hypothetical protein
MPGVAPCHCETGQQSSLRGQGSTYPAMFDSLMVNLTLTRPLKQKDQQMTRQCVAFERTWRRTSWPRFADQQCRPVEDQLAPSREGVMSHLFDSGRLKTALA